VKQGEGAVGRLLSYSFRTSDRQVEKTQDLVDREVQGRLRPVHHLQGRAGREGPQVNVQTSVDRSAVVSSSLSEAVLLMYVDVDSESTARVHRRHHHERAAR